MTKPRPTLCDALNAMSYPIQRHPTTLYRRVTVNQRLLQRDDQATQASRDTQHASDSDTVPHRVICCSRCRHPLADPRHRFAIGPAGDLQVHANKYGYIHQIMLLTQAPGARALGGATTEFTWFPGYAWRMAHCGGCLQHLGWRYQAVAQRARAMFWGLRREQIIEINATGGNHNDS